MKPSYISVYKRKRTSLKTATKTKNIYCRDRSRLLKKGSRWVRNILPIFLKLGMKLPIFVLTKCDWCRDRPLYCGPILQAYLGLPCTIYYLA